MNQNLRAVLLAAVMVAFAIVPSVTGDPLESLPKTIEDPDVCEALNECEATLPTCKWSQECALPNPCAEGVKGCIPMPCPTEVCQHPCAQPDNDCVPECPTEVCQNPCVDAIVSGESKVEEDGFCGLWVPDCPTLICQNECTQPDGLSVPAVLDPAAPDEACGVPLPYCTGEACECATDTPGLVSNPIAAALAYAGCFDVDPFCMEDGSSGGAPSTDSPDDSGHANAGLLDGYSTWQFGITETAAMPCGTPTPQATPLIPGGADLGGFVDPPFRLPYMVSDPGCVKPSSLTSWSYHYQMSIDVHDARYVGEAPAYPAMGSVVAYDIDEVSMSSSGSSQGFFTKEGCEANLAIAKMATANSLLLDAHNYVKSKPWDIHGEAHYLRDAAGDWKVKLPGRGQGELDYLITMGSAFLTIGTEAFEFEARWVIAEVCTPSTVNPRICTTATIFEKSESII